MGKDEPTRPVITIRHPGFTGAIFRNESGRPLILTVEGIRYEGIEEARVKVGHMGDIEMHLQMGEHWSHSEQTPIPATGKRKPAATRGK
jgi:hypothetical protein